MLVVASIVLLIKRKHVASVECIILTLGELGDVESIVSNLIDDLTVYQTNSSPRMYTFLSNCKLRSFTYVMFISIHISLKVSFKSLENVDSILTNSIDY